MRHFGDGFYVQLSVFSPLTEELTSGNSDPVKVKSLTFTAEVRACFVMHVLHVGIYETQCDL